MSGGSYNYLCYKDAQDIVDYQTDLADMQARLSGLDYAQVAAKDTQAVLDEIRVLFDSIEVKIKALQPIWRAVEWWDSNDSGEDAVKAAIANYKESELTS